MKIYYLGIFSFVGVHLATPPVDAGTPGGVCLSTPGGGCLSTPPPGTGRQPHFLPNSGRISAWPWDPLQLALECCLALRCGVPPVSPPGAVVSHCTTGPSIVHCNGEPVSTCILYPTSKRQSRTSSLRHAVGRRRPIAPAGGNRSFPVELLWSRIGAALLGSCLREFLVDQVFDCLLASCPITEAESGDVLI